MRNTTITLLSTVLLATSAGCSRGKAKVVETTKTSGGVVAASVVGLPSTRVYKAPPPPLALEVPHTTGPIAINGELDEASWRKAARTSWFVDASGEPARPSSEARFMVDDDTLYVALYAADQDVRAKGVNAPTPGDDTFWLELALDGGNRTTRYHLDVNPRGAIAGTREVTDGKTARARERWESHAKVAVDLDGTIDEPSDEDEEWVVEAAIPLASLGVGPRKGGPLTLHAAAGRCDTPKDSTTPRCGAWGAAKANELPLGSLVIGVVAYAGE